jgi:hypothetical protein
MRQLAWQEKLVLLAIVASLFSYWPTIILNKADGSGLELAMLSGVVLSIVGLVSVRSLVATPHLVRLWLPLTLWAVYGIVLSLVRADEMALQALRSGYLLSVMGGAVTVSFFMARKSLRLDRLMEAWLVVATLASALALAQFILASLGWSTVIRDTYDVGTFAFPRVHLVSFEPLFFANWLLVPIIYLFYAAQTSIHSTKNTFANILLCVAFFLTLSRGAFVALASIVVLSLFLVQRERLVNELHKYARLLLPSLFVALVLVGWSGSRNDAGFINSIGRYLDHASFGAFNPVGGQNVEREKIITKNGQQKDTLVTSKAADRIGTVEGSVEGRRESAASAWSIATESVGNALFGAGLFRFGEEAHSREPEIYTTPKQVSNNQYLDIFVETGLVGLAFWCWFAVGVLQAQLHSPQTKSPYWLRLAVVALLVQFVSFSGYFLLPFWLVLGLLVGLDMTGGRKKHA